jgi:hypothetical protein
MTTITPKEIEQQIITRLENSDDRNDIILDLCESQDMDWRHAEALVDSIHARNADNITLSQSPLLILLALAIFLGGAGLISYAIYNAVSVYKTIYWLHSQAPNNGSSVFWEVVHDFLFYMMLTGSEYFGMLVLGIGMIVGSLRGMQDVWSAVFAKLGIFSERRIV